MLSIQYQHLRHKLYDSKGGKLYDTICHKLHASMYCMQCSGQRALLECGRSGFEPARVISKPSN